MHKTGLMIVGGLLLLNATAPAFAQGTTSSAKMTGRIRATMKIPPKSPPQQPPVKGTTQMAGDNGKIGVTYTLGKGIDAINFTLLRAEYVTRVVTRDRIFIANEDEKLLVLHYTAQNPNARESSFNWSALRFTAVDSENVNREGVGLAGKEGTPDIYALSLKPGQKIDVFTLLKLPASATIPKLIVQRHSTLPVLRLYLKPEDIKGLPAPFGDPADANGAIARADVPGEKDIYYPHNDLDVKVVDAKYEPGNLDNLRPTAGNQFYIVTVSLKNATTRPMRLGWPIVDSKLKTVDGETINRKGLIMPRRTDSLTGELEPGEEFTARFYYQIPKDAQVAKVSIWQGGKGRRLTYDVKDWK